MACRSCSVDEPCVLCRAGHRISDAQTSFQQYHVGSQPPYNFGLKEELERSTSSTEHTFQEAAMLVYGCLFNEVGIIVTVNVYTGQNLETTRSNMTKGV